MKRRTQLLIALFVLFVPALTSAQSDSLKSRIDAIVNRPEFRHALFGIELYSPSDNKILYALNADKLFVPGSVTKVVTEGTAMELLGTDYRFRTPIYRTGAVSQDGVLNGNLVLVASGDPNLSNRVRPDGTLAFENVDHSYGSVLEAKLVPGDPLQVVRDLAKQVAKAGVKKVDGRVLVDVSLFPEGTKEGGTAVVISPIAVNDNVIDVIVTPGKSAGEAASVQTLPQTGYAKFGSEVKTVAADGETEINFVAATSPDGGLLVKVVGTVAAGKPPRPFPFAVPRPSKFAEVVLTEALEEAGVQVAGRPGKGPDWKALAKSYTLENRLAEHVSPPLKEDVKVTLKVSQNLHAAMMPYLLGARLGRPDDEDALSAGFKQERAFLQKNQLDVAAAAQSDGAGGAAYFTPDFIVKFLAMMARQKDGASFKDALPILGRDGSLWETQRNSPAAGKFHAKTGTHATGDLLNQQIMLNGKGLAGYLDAADGKQIIVAIFANHVPAGADFKTVQKIGDALGEIAAAAYDSQ